MWIAMLSMLQVTDILSLTIINEIQ
jgi:hypothetical protein